MISVIIVNYFSADLTGKALRSVLLENEKAEIIIIDNSTTREERQKLEKLPEAENLRLLFNPDNVGFAKACNQAFSLAKGDYILLLNPDAYIITSCLRLLRAFMEKTPDAGAVSPQVYWDSRMEYFFPYYTYPSPAQDFLVKLAQASFFFGTLFSLYNRRKNLNLWKAPHSQKTANLHGGVVMLSRTAVEHAGGLFDERFFMYYEDSDLFLRLKKAGYKLYILPTAKAVHSYCHEREKLGLMLQAGRLFYEKHFKGNLMLKLAEVIPESSKTEHFAKHGDWNSPPVFPVPAELRDGFLFEWSPSALFAPSIGCFGKGGTFALSKEVWDLLEDGTYYSRLAPVSNKVLGHKTYVWNKVK